MLVFEGAGREGEGKGGGRRSEILKVREGKSCEFESTSQRGQNKTTLSGKMSVSLI